MIKKIINFIKKHQITILAGIIFGLTVSFIFNFIKKFFIKTENLEMPIEQQQKQQISQEEKQVEKKIVIDRKTPPEFENLLQDTNVEYREEEENQKGWWAQATKGEIIPIIYKKPVDTWIFPY